MRFELKGFQDDAVARILTSIEDARRLIQLRGTPQAVVLSSPTGSGKTITVAAVLERVLTGIEGELGANPRATVLWISDSPELNAQSRAKIAAASDAIAPRRLVMIDTDFDREVFEPGVIYFLNTQKLSKNSLLLKEGDERNWSIWSTIRNTVDRCPEDFYVVIDEAHRGMSHPDEIETAKTIIQKFILGSSEIPAVPLVIGMSATPQRFADLLGASARTAHPVPIDPADVRESGLLKDRIILIHPGEDQPSDFTLLGEAVRAWREIDQRWREYCESEGEPEIVRPMLVVQVEDGTESNPTRTDLGRVIDTIRSVYPELGARALVHSFDSTSPLEVRGYAIRKVEPSKLQEDPDAEVVLFKRALTTGWVCPRAEVIMSFRRAVDTTMIAQLVGRMVRSPLARRVEGDDGLNEVQLYLPYYDRESVDRIIAYLSEIDPSDGMPIQGERRGDGINYPRAANVDEYVTLIESLPSYRITRTPKQPEAKRLLRLGFLVTSKDGLDSEAKEEALESLLSVLEAERDRLRKKDDFVARVIDTGEIEVRKVLVDVGEREAAADEKITIPASPENIDDLFKQMGRRLAPGEDLHIAFWKRNFRDEEPLRAKIEFIVTAQNAEARRALEERAGALYDEIYERNKLDIARLSERKREVYARLQGVAQAPRTVPIILPERIHERRGSGPFRKHIYADESGLFEASLNTWEEAVLERELPRDDIVAWLRNQERKPWALCIPYEDRRGAVRGFYPDFLFLRRTKGGILVDVVEPHDISRDDSWKKAVGMAKYAAVHGNVFGRMLIGMLQDGDLLTVDANDRKTRTRLEAVSSNDDLRNLIVDQK